ncbi:MAG: polymer-forming cytoskeletal protein [Oscillospiraceae bacterium]|nr:polymer-forming cytoskeletal protein [Oscillospiraceae bacterium]
MKTEKSKRLKGAVLFTVVSVMSLLIIFLMGTLLLASAANKRAQKSYAVSQAEYTAKTAIESFTKAMESSEEIAGAVQGLNSSIYPEIIINEGAGTKSYSNGSSYSGDGTLGKVGCYKNNTFLPNHIAVEPVPNSEKYYYDEIEGWVELVTVRISATVQLAGEEKTVSAYIRKRAPHEISESEIKGLQTAGGANLPNGGTYTGGLGVGLENDKPQISTPYSITNATTLETNLTFINGSLKAATSSLGINVLSSESETVIMGDLFVDNNKFINVDYTMSGQYTQKEVPYLYVDGGMAFGSSGPVVTGNRSPYNIFAGTINITKNPKEFNAADLYLMDTVTGEQLTVKEEGTNGNPIFKGKNKITANSGSSLSSWVCSVAEKTETQFSSTGGNIYCMGDLELAYTTINGDVRVVGNVVIGPNVKINGDLVVGGTLTLNDTPVVRGTIYTDSPVGDAQKEVLKQGYTLSHNNYHSGLLPGFTKVATKRYDNVVQPSYEVANNPVEYLTVNNKKIENLKFENESIENVLVEDSNIDVLEAKPANWDPKLFILQSSYSGYEYKTFDEPVILYGCKLNNKVYEEKPYYQVNGVDEENNPVKTGEIVDYPITYFVKDKDGVTTNQLTGTSYTYYKMDKDGNATDEVVDYEYTIYRVANDEVTVTNDIVDTDVTYYEKIGGSVTETILTEEQTMMYYEVSPNGNVGTEKVEESKNYFKVDKEGNPIVQNGNYVKTDEENTIYKVDMNGNVTDEETDIQEVKYIVDADGNFILDQNNKAIETYETYIYFLTDETKLDSNFKQYNADIINAAKNNKNMVPADRLSQIVGVYYTDENGNIIYDAEGKFSQEATTYFDPSGNVVSKNEAVELITIQHTSVGLYGKEIYPSSMTRDAILGYVRDANGNITDEIDDSNKIVERIEEVRKSLGYDATPVLDQNGQEQKDANGNTIRVGYDTAKYTDHIPSGFDVSQQACSFANNNVTMNRAVCDNAGNINKSCTISGSIPQNKTIKIKPTSEIWIVLDNVTVDTSEIIVDESGGGKVNFLIKGTLSVNNGKIRTKKIKEGVVVRATDNMNVTIYGEQNSAIVMTNNSLVCGAAKAPYTKLTQKCTGPVMVQYVDEYGNMSPKKPAWIGNALVKEVVEAQNEFILCYTKAGSSSPNYIDTEVGLWEINYFEQY